MLEENSRTQLDEDARISLKIVETQRIETISSHLQSYPFSRLHGTLHVPSPECRCDGASKMDTSKRNTQFSKKKTLHSLHFYDWLEMNFNSDVAKAQTPKWLQVKRSEGRLLRHKKRKTGQDISIRIALVAYL